MNYSIVWEPSGFLATFSGSLSVEDIHDANIIFHGDERFDRLKYSIWDVTGADMSTIQPDDMLILVAEDFGATFTLPVHKLALIATDPHAKYLMEYYIEKSISCGSSWTFKIHDTRTAARNWIST